MSEKVCGYPKSKERTGWAITCEKPAGHNQPGSLRDRWHRGRNAAGATHYWEDR